MYACASNPDLPFWERKANTTPCAPTIPRAWPRRFIREHIYSMYIYMKRTASASAYGVLAGWQSCRFCDAQTTHTHFTSTLSHQFDTANVHPTHTNTHTQTYTRAHL